MGLWAQIFYGTVLLSICAAIHLGLIISSLPTLRRVAGSLRAEFRVHHAGMLIGVTFALTVVGHTLQIWTWALVFFLTGTLGSLEEALYFALSSYTTLGYGDVVLDKSLRIFGAFSSVSGMLMFGVSTAFLVGVIGRVLPRGLR